MAFPSRLRNRTVIAAAAAAAVTSAALAERRHLSALATDPDLRELTAPLGGRPLAPAVSADGTRLHVEAFGAEAEDAPTLVLAHGWTERLALWGPVIRRLAGPERRVLAYDLRGHGDSEPGAAGDYAIERQGEDIEAVLTTHTTAAARTAIAGHSLGAIAIVAWAASFDAAARVGAAGLVCTGLSDLLGGALVLGELGARLTPDWMFRGFLSSSRRVPPSTPLSAAITRRVAFGPDASPGMVAFCEKMLVETDPAARAASGLAAFATDLSAAVPRMTVPTLLVAGAADRLTPPVHARRIHQALPLSSKLVVLPRAGHMAPLERPAELASALAEMLDRATVTATTTAASGASPP